MAQTVALVVALTLFAAWAVTAEVRLWQLRRKVDHPLLRMSVRDYSNEKSSETTKNLTNAESADAATVLQPVEVRMRNRSYNPIRAAMERDEAEVQAWVKANQNKA